MKSKKPPLDWIGVRYGKLTCLKKSNIPGRPKHYYDFQCDCGTIKSIDGYSVRNGDVVSCGCHRNELRKSKEQGERIRNALRAKSLNLEGERVGLLTYVGEHARIKEPGRAGTRRFILVKCECGTVKSIACDSFVGRIVYSCGCVKDQLSTQRIMAIHTDPAYERDPNTGSFRKAKP